MGALVQRFSLQVDLEVFLEALIGFVRVSAISGVPGRAPDQLDADLFRAARSRDDEGDLTAQDRVVRGLVRERRRVKVQDILEERDVDRVPSALEEGDHRVPAQGGAGSRNRAIVVAVML